MDTAHKIGMLLKEKRLAKGYSLADVGRIMKKNKSTIYYYETARIIIDVVTLEQICNVYGVDMYDFLDEVRKI